MHLEGYKLQQLQYLKPATHKRNSIDPFTKLKSNLWMYFPQDLVTSNVINLYLTMVYQYLESPLHTLVVAMSDKPQTSFQVVRNNLC